MVTRGNKHITNMDSFCSGKQRLNQLDKLKAICAFFIVCIHAPFPGIWGEYFTCLTRIAVPIFFMISGYFFSPIKVKEQIIKVFELVVVSNLLYLILGLIKAIMRHNLMDYITSVFTIKKLALFLAVNQSPFAIHLWYLGAILYVYIVFSIAEKYGWIKWLKWTFPVLLLFDLVLGKYSLLLFHREFSIFLVRNWFFVGIPFFSIGLIIKKNSLLLSQKFGEKALLLSIVVFSVTSVLERWLLVSYQVNAIRDQYISTVFLSVVVFLHFLYYINNQQNAVARIGCNYSTWIYVIHYALIMFLGLVMKSSPQIDVFYRLVRPFVIFVLSVLLVRLTRKIHQ